MREIKFRAWNGKEMFTNWDWLTSEEGMGITLVGWLNNNYQVMQYTGLKDKNDKEIFEGDIIKISYGTVNFENKKEIVTDVYFGKAAFRYRHKDESGSVLDFNSVKIVRGYERITQDVEIIGNIYENPELLKGLYER